MADMCFSGASQFGLNGPVLNPHDKLRTSGGSSAGSGVVVIFQQLLTYLMV